MAFFDSKNSDLYIAQYDVTPYTTELSGVPGARPLLPVTAWGDSGEKSIPGIETPEVSWTGMFDEATLDVLTAALRSDSDGEVLSFLPAGDTIEYVAYAAQAMLIRDTNYASRVGSVVGARFVGPANGVIERGKSLGAAFSAVTATENGTIIDDGASSSDGAILFGHITAFSATGGNARWQMLLQADDNSDLSSPAQTITQNITAVGGFWATLAGSFERYVRRRLVLDATSGSISGWLGYVRG